MLAWLDLFGTLVFAVSGAFRAVKYELDLLGVLVLATATGVGGGIIRDLLIGAKPLAALSDERYLTVCIIGGLLVFVSARRIATRWDKVMLADALGLGVFAAIGAIKATEYGLGPIGVLIMSALTATGGGVIRDMLVNEVPMVLKRDFYATAALIGGGVFLLTGWCGLERRAQVFLVVVITTGLRVLAMARRFHLPQVHSLPDSPTEMTKTAKLIRRGKGEGEACVTGSFSEPSVVESSKTDLPSSPL